MGALEGFGFDPNSGAVLGTDVPAVPEGQVPKQSPSASALAGFGFDAKTGKPLDVTKVPLGKIPPPSEPAVTPAVRQLSAQRGLPAQATSGIPLVGSMMDLATAASRARQPDPNNADYFDRLTARLNEQRAADRFYQSQHPVASTVAQLGTGVATTLPMGLIPGVRALYGMSPALPVAAQAWLGGLGQSGIGAIDELIRGGDPLRGATIGGVGGVAGPLIAGGVNRGITSGLEAAFPQKGLENLPAAARRLLSWGVEGETPQSVQDAISRMGPRGFLADVNPRLTTMTGGLADLPETAGPIRQAYRQRAMTSSPVVNQALDNSFGPEINLATVTRQTTAAQKASANPLYEAWKNTPVTTTPELNGIIDHLQDEGIINNATRLMRLDQRPVFDFARNPRGQFLQGKKVPTAEAWDYIKQALDGNINEAQRKGDNNSVRVYSKLKNQIDTAMQNHPDQNVWNTWSAARESWANPEAIKGAREAGEEVWEKKIDPNELSYTLNDLDPPERTAYLQGARYNLARKINGSRSGDQSARNMLLAPDSQQKIRALVDDPVVAQHLIDTLHQESFFADQYPRVVPNPNTGASAMTRKEGVNLFAPPVHGGWDFDLMKPGTWLPQGSRFNDMIQALINQRNARVAPSLVGPMTTGPGPQMNALVAGALQRSATEQRRQQILGRALAPASGFIAGPGQTSYRRSREGYQFGGRPPPGVPAMVGEGGPELFLPDRVQRPIGQPGGMMNGTGGGPRNFANLNGLSGGPRHDQALNGLMMLLNAVGQGNAAPHFQEGGRPDPGQPAVVGEDGPEMFIPDREWRFTSLRGRRPTAPISQKWNALPESTNVADERTRSNYILGMLNGMFNPGRMTWDELKNMVQHPTTPYWELYPPTAAPPATGLAAELGAGDIPARTTASPGLNRMPGYQEGGRPQPDQPSIVGESGPEMFIPDQPGTVVPNSVLRTMAAHRAVLPGSAEPLTRMLWPNLASLAAGEPGPSPGPLPATPGKVSSGSDPRAAGGAMEAVGTLGALAGIPEARMAAAGGEVSPGLADLMSRVSQSPIVSRGTIGAGMVMGSPSSAIAADDPRIGELNTLQKRIDDAQAQIFKLGTTKTPSPKGTQAQTITTLQQGIASDQARMQQLHAEMSAEEERSRTAQEQAEQERTAREMSIRQRFPIPGFGPAANLLPFVGLGTGGLGGRAIGSYYRSGQDAASQAWWNTVQQAQKQFAKKGGKTTVPGRAITAELKARQAEDVPGALRPLVYSGAAGLGESAVPQMALNMWDQETLPIGSPNQTQAAQNWRDPYWWASRVAPAAGMSTLMGLIGAGHGLRRGGAPVMPPRAETQALLNRR